MMTKTASYCDHIVVSIISCSRKSKQHPHKMHPERHSRTPKSFQIHRLPREANSGFGPKHLVHWIICVTWYRGIRFSVYHCLPDCHSRQTIIVWTPNKRWNQAALVLQLKLQVPSSEHCVDPTHNQSHFVDSLLMAIKPENEKSLMEIQWHTPNSITKTLSLSLNFVCWITRRKKPKQAMVDGAIISTNDRATSSEPFWASANVRSLTWTVRLQRFDFNG